MLCETVHYWFGVSRARLGLCRLGSFDLAEKIIATLGLIVRPIDKERPRGGDVGFRLAQNGRVWVQPIPREGEVGDIPLENRPREWRVRFVVQCLAGPTALSRGVGQTRSSVTSPRRRWARARLPWVRAQWICSALTSSTKAKAVLKASTASVNSAHPQLFRQFPCCPNRRHAPISLQLFQ